MIDLAKIDPKNGSKFSPNLFKFIKSKRANLLCSVYKDTKGTLYIGHVDNDYGDGPWFTGAQLITVLCLGLSSTTYAKAVRENEFVEVVGFWDDYYKNGRCAIDANHTGSFMGDDDRWNQSGDKRECTWCGNFSQVLRRWTVQVEKSEWVSAVPQHLQSTALT